MTAAKHTPGPWHTYVADRHTVAILKRFKDGQESHQIGRCTSGFADARLIASAPDLLDALQDAMKTADFERHPFRPWHAKARAAIAKATGEGA